MSALNPGISMRFFANLQGCPRPILVFRCQTVFANIGPNNVWQTSTGIANRVDPMLKFAIQCLNLSSKSLLMLRYIDQTLADAVRLIAEEEARYGWFTNWVENRVEFLNCRPEINWSELECSLSWEHRCFAILLFGALSSIGFLQSKFSNASD